MRERGFTLIEAVVATAVLATAGVALQALVARSVATIERDARRARTLLAARTLVAEAALVPPPIGRTAGERPGGVRFTREVIPTPHRALHQVRVRAETAAGGDATELVELIGATAR